MKYTIKEFSELLGITSDTLRLYEKYHIIHPHRDDKNNYRYYTDLDVRHILTSRRYRSLGIPLEDTSELIRNASLHEIKRYITNHESDLVNELFNIQAKLDAIAQLRQDIEIPENQIATELRPAIIRINQTKGCKLINHPSLKETVKEWMNLLPYTTFTFYYSYNCQTINWGLGITLDRFMKLDIKTQEKLTQNSEILQYLDQQMCYSTTIKGDGNSDKLLTKLSCIYDSLVEEKDNLKGEFYGEIIVPEGSIHNCNYLKVYIPST